MESSDIDHSTLDDNLSIEAVKQKTIRGIAVLTGRNFILQIFTLLVNFVLTVLLTPNQYGVFFLVQAVINFFAYFSDIGLAAALVQKGEQPDKKELSTTFTIQQILVVLVIFLILLLTPLLREKYNLDLESTYLLWSLALSLLFSSLKTIPSVLLERRLDFNKLVIPQIIEAITFNVIVLILAWRGFGVTSFTYAVLVRGIVGLVAIYYVQPWRPSFAWSRPSLNSLLTFGLPYQANTFLALIKDDGMTIILGSILGTSGIGLLGWAQKWGTAPLRFFMDQVVRVTFPAYSRMQHDYDELARFLSKSIFFICLFVFPSIVGLVLLAPVLTEVIPKYGKWQPALLALGLIGFNSAWAAITTPLTNVLNAIGKIKLTFRLMIMWTLLSWLLVPTLAIYFGVNGAATGFALVGLSSIIAIIVAGRLIHLNFWIDLAKICLAVVIMGFVVNLAKTVLETSLVEVISLIILGVVSYCLMILLLFGRSAINNIRLIAANLR